MEDKGKKEMKFSETLIEFNGQIAGERNRRRRKAPFWRDEVAKWEHGEGWGGLKGSKCGQIGLFDTRRE